MTEQSILVTVLMRLRCERSDGFREVGTNGKYKGRAGFITMGLPSVTPEELDALMELAGIVPDPIVPNGSCGGCRHATPDGKARGWAMPCAGCLGVKHDKFDPMRKGTVRTGSFRGDKSCQCRVCKSRDESWTRGQERRRKCRNRKRPPARGNG